MLETTTIPSLVQASFTVGYVSMGGAALFFLAARRRVAPPYRAALALSGFIAGIAAMHHCAMAGAYAPGMAYPTAYRYIDWMLTTPLMLMVFPALVEHRGQRLVALLLPLNILMLVAGYLGESGLAPWLCLAVGVAAWTGILAVLWGAVFPTAAALDGTTRRMVRALCTLVTGGWAIYPLGYAARAADPGLVDLVQLVYNGGDMVNKIGCGAVVYCLAATKPVGVEKGVPQHGTLHLKA